jgi:N-methylhydantoinase B/oxoprolinase/acetone carboxylase alpha subunit
MPDDLPSSRCSPHVERRPLHSDQPNIRGRTLLLPSACWANTDTVTMEPGDVIHIQSLGGGGHGDPLDCQPERVALDVQRGSGERLHFAYGPERDAREANWTNEAYAELTNLLAALPVH